MQDTYEEIPPPDAGGRRLLEERPWLAFVLPMAVYMVLGSLEPSAPAAGLAEGALSEPQGLLGVRYEHYPIVYTFKIIATLGAILYVWPVYRQWPVRVSPLAILVGVVGVVLWVGIDWIGIEERFVQWVGPESDLIGLLGMAPRPAYNPLEQLEDSPAMAWGFLAVRFFGLALIVPIIEEMLLRGWLMRSIDDPAFWRIPIGQASVAAIVVGTAFPMVYHPEKLASLVWFSLVTWLMIRTKNIWDCVAAHAVTNFLLGVWVVATGAWHLW